MLKPSMNVSLEGIPFIILSAFATLLCAMLDLCFLTLIFFALTAFIGHFFRDPEVVEPLDESAIVAPADGKVVKITKEIDPITGESLQMVAIFMNVFNVHVNRMPVAGKVTGIHYIPGKKMNIAFDKASKDNERNLIEVETASGDRFLIIQIAGLLARRIVCWAEKSDTLKRSERFGLIKFGSRVDLYFPDTYKVNVKVGDKVTAGQSVLLVKE